MENFSKKIENIIKEEYEKTNRKLIGINFLESFKFNLISKISTFKESEFFEENFEDKKNFIISSRWPMLLKYPSICKHTDYPI